MPFSDTYPDLDQRDPGLYNWPDDLTPRRRLQSSVPMARQPGAAGFDPNGPSRDPWYADPLDPAAFRVTSSGASGSGDNKEPQPSGATGPTARGAALLARGEPAQPPPGYKPETGAASPATPTATQPQPPPSSPQQQPPPGTAPISNRFQQLQQDQQKIEKPIEEGGMKPTLKTNWAQRLALAVLSATKLAPYANQIVHPKYTEQMGQFQAAEDRIKEQYGEASQAARGEMEEAYAGGAKLRPILMKDGSIYDPRTGQITAAAPTPQERYQTALQIGEDPNTARAYALGLKPEDASKTTPIVYEGLPSQLKPMFKPDANGMVQVPTELLGKGLDKGTGEDQPLGPRVPQFGQLLAQRWQVLHPNMPVPAAYQLQPNATMRDYANIEHSLQSEEGAVGTEASKAASLALRQQSVALTQQVAAEHKQAADQRRSDQSYQFNVGELNKVAKPIEDLTQRMARLQDTIAQNSPQADALVAPELLSVMAGGQGSGLRMNEAEISRIVGGRNNWQALQSAVQKWQLDPTKPFLITPEQRRQIRALVGTVSQKLHQKQDSINQARDQLLGTDDPAAHRQIVSGVHTTLSGIDNPVEEMVTVRMADGKTGQIHPSQLENFLRDHPGSQRVGKGK